MASTQTKHYVPDLDTAFEQVRAAGEQYVEVTRKAGNLVLDTYSEAFERTLHLARSLID